MEGTDLQTQIRELLHASIRARDVRENDAVSLRTLKLELVARTLETLGLDWNYVVGLFKTHVPVHPEVAREVRRVGDDEASAALAQTFVRTEKVPRLAKQLGQAGADMDRILAVDGLGGNLEKGPNFEYRHYAGNLKYGSRGQPKSFFDTDPEYRRLHAQAVRELYGKLEKAPARKKQVYEILRGCFAEATKLNLPAVEMDKEEAIDKKLQRECAQFYTRTMGKENVESVARSLKRLRGEKRTFEREDETPERDEKR